MPSTENAWPALPVQEWDGTRDTLHLWTQMAGKVRLALTPLVNHWWNVPLYVDSRGLTTSLMPLEAGGLEIRFDFVDHRLRMLHTDGGEGDIALRPGTIAEFYAEFTGLLAELGADVELHSVPVELPDVVPFDQDTRPAPYDPEAAHRFWVSLVSASRVLNGFRAAYRGKASPVHFFWGAFDLATSRFSGRPAPQHPGGAPNCPDRVMHEAYDSEVSSAGYWPGGAAEGAFYSYAYPEPPGYRDRALDVDGAYFDGDLGEFVLPYERVRAADDPDAALRGFLDATYRRASASGTWPRETGRA
ncbi:MULTISPECIES: DUF5996 family protein [Microbacterium]|uniref:Ava_C0101 and related proteins n=1 Tax=Microbacterium wangchenii TaxID=2541726 RepID=A0ABX5SS18_9MICO|nr:MULTISPECIES: DUF5996 family protein [Microbacterium]MCK6065508.1 hypothetical protein [Microbacterium sp. EYE_512]QBR88934.1 hypothetical protein E4K62_09690 [Microbacterium wangchenii]